MDTTTETTTPPADVSPPPPRRATWFGRVVTAVVTLAVLAAIGGGYWWARLQTYHLRPVQATVLYRDGNRSIREFRHAVEQTGARTVVSLVSDREVADPAKPQFRQEADYCRDRGLQLVRIPVPLGGWPTSDQIKQFLTIVQDPANRPVLVHCAQGVRRTGMFVAAYQIEVQDRTPAVARTAVETFGHKPRDTDDVRTFIDNFDRATSAVPTSMPAVSPE